MSNHELIETWGVPIKAWTRGVGVEDAARIRQLENVARLPIVFRHVAAITDAADDPTLFVAQRLHVGVKLSAKPADLVFHGLALEGPPMRWVCTSRS